MRQVYFIQSKNTIWVKNVETKDGKIASETRWRIIKRTKDKPIRIL
jgi:hypothetical protein